jgi:tripartite-type tricarboxylate transporter receptor subunit TctC
METVRKNPGKIRAAVSGFRTTPDLAIQELNKIAGVKIATIPFTGGGGEALVALLGGRVEANVGYAPTMLAHAQAGSIRVIAAFTKEKYFAFPEATSVVQAGYNVTLPASYGIVAPKGMPADVIEKIITASLAIGKSPEFAKFAEKHGLVLDVKGPQGMDDEMNEYTRIFRDLIVFMDQKK